MQTEWDLMRIRPKPEKNELDGLWKQFIMNQDYIYCLMLASSGRSYYYSRRGGIHVHKILLNLTITG